MRQTRSETGTAHAFYRKFGKRAFDLLLVLTTAPIWVPLAIIVAVAVRLSMGAPVMYTQARVGRSGTPFVIRKFRTMSEASHNDGSPLADVDRITPLGAVLRSMSLDELPQLWQVIRGDLSIIGPRPLPIEYLSLYNDHQRRRHTVRPGITGAAQVQGRNTLPWDKRFAADVAYTENVSLRNDLTILAATLRTVISGAGVMESGVSTATPFRGNTDR